MRTVMAYLGNAIYWTANCIAAVFGLFALLGWALCLYYWSWQGDSIGETMFASMLALIAWLIGWSVKFVLTRVGGWFSN